MHDVCRMAGSKVKVKAAIKLQNQLIVNSISCANIHSIRIFYFCPIFVSRDFGVGSK